MIIFELIHPEATPETLGFIPEFLDDTDPRGAVEQLDANYQHGGGWRPMEGFVMLPDRNMKYPGDPPTLLLAECKFREEIVRMYDYSFVAVVQKDGTFAVARMD